MVRIADVVVIVVKFDCHEGFDLSLVSRSEIFESQPVELG